MELKQKYLIANSPVQVDYQKQKTQMFQRLILLISTNPRDRWLSTGFNCGSIIQAYKQSYGLTSQQFQVILSLLINIAINQKGINTDTKNAILKLLNTVTQFQIKITQKFKISNKGLLDHLAALAEQGPRGTLKSSDGVIQQLGKFILYYCKFGQQVIKEAFQLSIQFNDIRYLSIFIRSLKTHEGASIILRQLFSDNNLWDRDVQWFYLLSQVIKKFPQYDFSTYYHTIMQEIMRAFSTVIDPISQDAVKKITSSDSFLQVNSILKSIAMILAYLILPQSQPQHHFIDNCIERIFSIIHSSLDYINPPDYLPQILTFLKSFQKYFLLRYRFERGYCLLNNQDDLNDYNGEEKKNISIDQHAIQFFNSLQNGLISKIIFIQDPQQCRPSKIIVELVLFQPNYYLPIAFEAMKNVICRDDLSLVSIHGVKITILFLQQIIALDQQQYIPQFVQLYQILLSHLQKLGVTDNVDIFQLTFKFFQFIPQKILQLYCVQGLVNDCLSLILQNLQSISVALQGSDSQQAQLYLDLGNMFIPFLIRLDKQQLKNFTDKFLYHLTKTVPQHTQAYQNITIALCFIDDKLGPKILSYIEKQIIEQGQQQKQRYFLPKSKGKLHTKNQQILKWNAGLLQCAFQYHPQNLIKQWPRIQSILIALLLQWQQQWSLQLGLDIIYNLILCLCKQHIPVQDFIRDRNSNYRSLKVTWTQLTPQIIKLIDQIVDKYFYNIQNYLKQKFSQIIKNSPTQAGILGDFDSVQEKHIGTDIIRVRKRNLKLVDSLILAGVSEQDISSTRKLIYKALSIQYTVLSGLMIRIPYHSQMKNNYGLLQGKYINFRKQSCQYMQWVMQLYTHFHLFGDQNFLKLFNFFWRQSHDQVAYTAAINATLQRITPYYYAQLYKKKQLLRSPFLLVNQLYLAYMIRLQLQLLICPTAHNNNPRYLQSNIILGINTNYQSNLHSYFPPYIDVHQHHRQLMAIIRYHLSLQNNQGYLCRMLKQKKGNVKQQITTAIKCMIVSVRKLLNIFSDSCCMKDQFIRNTVFQLVSLYKQLPKRGDKSLIYQIIYITLIFSFDPACFQQFPDYNLPIYWSLKAQNKPQVSSYQVASTSSSINYTKLLTMIEEQQVKNLQNMQFARNLKLTRSCSFEDHQIQKQLQRGMKFLLTRMQQNISAPQKDFELCLIMAMLFSNNLPLNNVLIGRLLNLLFQVCQDKIQFLDIAKTSIFHIINRISYSLRKQTKHINAPVKRTFEQFLKYKFIGGQVDYQKIRIQKGDNNFYHSKQISEVTYSKLCDDSSRNTYQNQKILYNILQDKQGLLKFLKNCSSDPQLKSSQQATQNFTLSQEDFKSVSNTSHKLLHFLWDCNPTRTPLFMGILQKYTASPLNFYNRLFRKIIRISSDNALNTLGAIASHFRQEETQEEQIKRISIYISCQLMLSQLECEQTQKFINYIGESSKQNFDFVIVGIYGIFTYNFKKAEKCYYKLLQYFRKLKGASRFRHIYLLNTFIISQGRFAREAALEATDMLLKGISEGVDQISQAIVSMITQCYVQAINLKQIKQWVTQPLDTLVKQQKIFLLNEYVGYNHQKKLLQMLGIMMSKARQQQECLQSSKLRLYSQIVRKILASITIYRFNDYFYMMLKDLIVFVLERPQSIADDQADQLVIIQLSDSQYHEQAYDDLIKILIDLSQRSPYVIKKKLMFLQGLVIHRSFRLNKMDIPPLLQKNQKNLTLDSIYTISAIVRLMTEQQLTNNVKKLLNKNRQKHETYLMISILLATGCRYFEWRCEIMKDLIKYKKDKLVKEAISSWWKGKTPQTNQQKALGDYVKHFQNPYSYFA